MISRKFTYVLLACLSSIVLYSCANIGNPEGGPRDYTPPVLLKCSPANGSKNFKGNKMELTFDEIVQLKDQQKKVVVSPAQKEAPLIKVLGKKITVEFRDTMMPNTTYVVDFSNAIADNNEGNVLDGLSCAFSTGDSIDTLQVSGMVLRAKDLEPMQHVIVGVQSNLADSAFSTMPLERISRTNDLGQFTIRNLKPGRYHVFALNDVDGDYRMARSEDIAFLDTVISPTTSSFTSSDTTFTFDHRIDTVVTATHTEYLPNDLLLSMFNEEHRALYIAKSERQGRNKLHIKMSAPVSKLPELSVISPKPQQANWFRLERNANNDSLFYWLTDSALIKSDSLKVAVTHLRTGKNDSLELATDTLQFNLRRSNAELKEEVQSKKEKEKWEKERANIERRVAKAQSEGKEPDPDDLELLLAHKPKQQGVEVTIDKTSLAIGDSITLKSTTPLDTILTSGVRLQQLVDTVWTDMTALPPFVRANAYTQQRYVLPLQLIPGTRYKLTIDSAAIRSCYGLVNLSAISQEMSMRSAEEFANLYFTVQGLNTKTAFAQLLDGGDKPLRNATMQGNRITFSNVEPGTYYVRLIADANGNGKWDTGNYAKHQQPEDVYYYPKRLKLRKSWDVEENWDVNAVPIDKQKFDSLKKNRPDKQHNALERKDKKDNEADEETDEFNSNGFGNGIYSGDKYKDYRHNNRR